MAWPEDQTDHEVAIVIEVQGLPLIFTEMTMDDITPDTGRAVPIEQSVTLLPESVEIGDHPLSLDTRQEEGASISFQLVDDDDQRLFALFQPRALPVTFVASDILSASPTSITVGDNSFTPWTSEDGDDYIFIGQETIFFSGTSGGDTLTGTQASQFGTKRKNYFGGASTADSTEVFNRPTSWKGRKVTVWLYNLEDQTERQKVATGRLKGPPKWSAGDRWSFEAQSLSTSIRQKQLYVGLRAVNPKAGEEEFLLNGAFRLSDDDRQLFVTGLHTTYLLFENNLNDLKGLYSFLGVTGANDVNFGPAPSGMLNPQWYSQDASRVGVGGSGAQFRNLRHVGVFDGPASAVWLSALTSVLGDQSNGDYDIWPGKESTTLDGEEWRFGAGIDEADVNIESFKTYAANSWVSLKLFKQMSLVDLMTDMCRITGTYWFINSSDQIEIAPLRFRVPPSAGSALLDITDAILSTSTVEEVVPDEDSIKHTITYRTNYDYLTEKFGAESTTVDLELFRKFPESVRRVSIESKLINLEETNLDTGGRQRLASPYRTTLAELRLRLRREQAQSSKARLIVPNLEVNYKGSGVRAGQIVNITNDRMPDFKGSTLSSNSLLVLNRRPDVQAGRAILSGQILEAGFKVVPSFVVASYDAGTRTVTVKTSGRFAHLYTDSVNPTEDLPDNATIYITDESGDVTETNGVDSITNGTQFVIAVAPSFTPADGDIISLFQGASNAATTGFTAEDGLYQVSDDGLVNNEEGTRWS